MTWVPDTLISNYLSKQPQRRKPYLPYDIDPVSNKYACIYIAFLTETMHSLSWMDIGSYTHAYLQIQYSFIPICALSLKQIFMFCLALSKRKRKKTLKTKSPHFKNQC